MPDRKKPTEPFPPPFVTVDGNSIFFGDDPINIKCPKCSQQIVTTTATTPGILGINKLIVMHYNFHIFKIFFLNTIK